jgi:hypothetical protein
MLGWKAMARVVLIGMVAAGGAAWLVLPMGCKSEPHITGTLKPTENRSQRLMALAAQEAGHIPEPDMRLTRQLNLADQQIQRGWPADALITLGSARDTLQSNDATRLNEYATISGWISISQLARQITAAELARQACDSAVAAMEKLEDPAKRCQYVFGVANELQYLKGMPAAAAVLAKAGPWTRAIDNIQQRREAEVSFASALFNFDDYAAGQQMLRNDDDAAWRSDTLARLAAIPVGGAVPAEARRESSVKAFGRTLDYDKVFQNQLRSNTTND